VNLTAYLGWYYATVGDVQRALELRAWIEGCAEENGDLPEQISDHVNEPDMLEPWVKRWGPVATPLLWSHASYITLYAHLPPAARTASAAEVLKAQYGSAVAATQQTVSTGSC